MPISLHPVDSSAIAAIGYDRHREVLAVRYVSGATYEYLAVPPDIFAAFTSAESKGQFVNFVIKPAYAYRPVTD